MLKNTLVLTTAICMVAPVMAETPEAAETPTHAQMLEATKVIFEESAKIVDAATDAETAPIAAAGLNQITAMVKELVKVGSTLPEPTAEEMTELKPLVDAVQKAQEELQAAIKKCMEGPGATEEMKKAILDFGNAWGE